MVPGRLLSSLTTLTAQVSEADISFKTC
jgi:hypothetical protein